MEEDSFFSSRCRKGLSRSSPVWRRAMTTTDFFSLIREIKGLFGKVKCVRVRGLTANFLRVLSNHGSSSCTWRGRRGDSNETEGDILQIFPHTREPPSPPHTCIESCHQRTKIFLPCPRQKGGKKSECAYFWNIFRLTLSSSPRLFFPRESGGGGGNWVAALSVDFFSMPKAAEATQKRKGGKTKENNTYWLSIARKRQTISRAFFGKRWWGRHFFEETVYLHFGDVCTLWPPPIPCSVKFRRLWT